MSCAWLGASEYLCAVDLAGHIIIVDPLQQKMVSKTPAARGSYFSVVSNNDGSLIVTGDDEGFVTLWATPLSFSPEQLLLLVAQEKEQYDRLGWDPYWQEIFKTLPASIVTALSISA